VDDRPLNLKLLQEILHPLGFETRCASNGREAVVCFEQWRPEVVLMDTAMPEMDGVEATRRIRELERGKRAVILSISASAFDHDRAEILAAGATDFLAKPIREQDLLAILQKHLHLDYIYDENADPEPAVLSSLAGLSLADAPAELYTNMRQAFESGDLDALAELAAELPEPLAGFRAQIQDWAQQFAYDQLNQLFQGDRA
jgi:two-component system sensor histidine kinase/response regulator